MQEEEVPKNLQNPSQGFREVNPLATDVLQRNGVKSWTKPAPSLYPHQWSWDSAFIALGLAHFASCGLRGSRLETRLADALDDVRWQGLTHRVRRHGASCGSIHSAANAAYRLSEPALIRQAASEGNVTATAARPRDVRSPARTARA